jgi:hypothetical protein
VTGDSKNFSALDVPTTLSVAIANKQTAWFNEQSVKTAVLLIKGEKIMAITTAASRLGTEPFSETRRVELRPNASREEVELVIKAVYRQVLGNDYIGIRSPDWCRITSARWQFDSA